MFHSTRGHPPPYMRDWEETIVEEHQVYLGLQILMGLQHKSYMQDLWSHGPLNVLEIFPQNIFQDWFDAITSALHFANHPADDQL